VIGVPTGGPAYDRYGKERRSNRGGVDVMLSDYRHWLEYDSVALAVLFVGVGLVELIVLSI
jgi:hypothetical protein